MFLEEIVHTWEDEIALIFTGRSVGALGGWLLSVAILEDAPEYCGTLIGSGLFGLALVNFGVAFSHHLWWLLAAFAFQGGFIVVAAQGGCNESHNCDSIGFEIFAVGSLRY